MCGIAGWYDRKAGLQGQDNVIKIMSESMERRGPDDSGIYQDDHLCLMHRRLAVIDPDGGEIDSVAVFDSFTATLKQIYATCLAYGYNISRISIG